MTPQVKNQSTAKTQLVVFKLGDEEYALPIACVQEIIRYTEPRSVASKDRFVRGVINLRGNIVPIYDLKERLGLPAFDADNAKLVIIELATGVAGAIVDEVTEVLTTEIGDFEDVPAADHDAISGVVKLDQRLLVLLDPENVVPRGDGDGSLGSSGPVAGQSQ